MKTIKQAAERIAQIIEQVDNRCRAGDTFPLKPTKEEMREAEFESLYLEAKFIAERSEPKCKHPIIDWKTVNVCFVSQRSYDNLVRAGVTSILGTKMVLDEKMTDTKVHFPQPDGTCAKYNV